MPQYDVISFLSDMGMADESVGVCKAIMHQQAPHVHIIDVTHEVPAFDVRAGALALTRAIQFLPNGIVLAAVDPGAPRDQRYIAVEMAEGILLGPDNGILAPAAQLIGEPKRVVELTNPEFRIDAPGGVFAARDILSPAAGVLAAGIDIKELGKTINLEELVPGMLQLSRHDEGGAFLGEVWSVDRFGNVQINITPEELAASNVRVGDTVVVRVGANDFMVKYVEHYADLAIAQIGILVDSTGMISIVKNLDNASRELEAKEGKAIAILPQGATITGRDIPIEGYSEALAETPERSSLADKLEEASQYHIAPSQPTPVVPSAPVPEPTPITETPLTPLMPTPPASAPSPAPVSMPVPGPAPEPNPIPVFPLPISQPSPVESYGSMLPTYTAPEPESEVTPAPEPVAETLYPPISYDKVAPAPPAPAPEPQGEPLPVIPGGEGNVFDLFRSDPAEDNNEKSGDPDRPSTDPTQ